MDDSKRYYWLKLKEDFFEDDTIQWLEEQENGKEYTLFYLKLCLKSLSLDGKIIRIVGEKLIPYDKKALAKITNTDLDTVTVAMNLFVQIGLLEIMDTGAIYMKQIDEMVGSETNAAIRKRKYRATIEQRDIVPELSQGSPTENRDKSIENRDKSIEKEIEKEYKEQKNDETHSSAELTDNFEKLWSLYPNKQGKKKAFSSYQKAIKEGTANKEIQDGIVKYKKHLTANDWLKPANGSTWFGNERWNDEYEVTIQKKPKKDWESELSELNGH